MQIRDQDELTPDIIVSLLNPLTQKMKGRLSGPPFMQSFELVVCRESGVKVMCFVMTTLSLKLSRKPSGIIPRPHATSIAAATDG